MALEFFHTQGRVMETSVNWVVFFFSSRRRHTRLQGDWSSDVCSSDLTLTELMSRKTPVGWMPAFLSASSTRPSTVLSIFKVVRAVDSCTAGASPKKLGSV